MDLGVKDGRYVSVEREIPATDARHVFDTKGLLGFPGLVDARTHAGIYSPPAEGTVTESKGAAMVDFGGCGPGHHTGQSARRGVR